MSQTPKKNRWRWIGCGFAVLLTGSYFDNGRGPLLPVLRQVFSLSYEKVSWFLIAGYLASIVSTYALIPLSHRWRSAHLSFAVCVLGLITALSAPFIHSYFPLIVMAAGLGATVSALGAMANILVLEGTAAGGNRSRYLCGLHSMYGLGSLLGPAAASWLFAWNRPWSELLLIGVPPLLALSVFAWRGLPPVGGGPDPLAAEADASEHRLSWSYRKVLLLVVFSLYVGAEVMTSSWLVAYLADARHLEVDFAAPYLTGFFFMMTVTRLFCFWRIRLEWEKRLMTACLVAAASLFLLGRSGWTLGFALSGVLGPVFPLLLAQMSREFPREAPILAYWVVTTMQVTLALCNFGMGYFTDHFGIRVAYWVPAVFYALTLAALVPYFTTSSTERRLENI